MKNNLVYVKPAGIQDKQCIPFLSAKVCFKIHLLSMSVLDGVWLRRVSVSFNGNEMPLYDHNLLSQSADR